MAEQFLQLSRDDRREVLAIAAEKVGRPIHLLEKDTWVVWALQTLYGTALAEHLVFKGGTARRTSVQCDTGTWKSSENPLR